MHQDTNPLLSAIRGQAGKQPNAPFITQLNTNETISYSQIFETAQKLAALFNEYNIPKKSRVAFLVQNHWLVFPMLLAASLSRISLVLLDPELHRDEIVFILSDSAPQLIITPENYDLPNYSGEKRVLSITLLQQKLTAMIPPEVVDDSSKKDDVILMIYTSGTTSSNKCVRLTNENLATNAVSLATRYQVTPKDRFFCFLPTFHMNAIMITGLVPLIGGAQVFLSDTLSFKNAKHFWKNLREHKISLCSLAPSIMALLIKLFPEGLTPDEIPDELRFAFCGAAPLPAALWKEFEDKFNVRVYQGYGLTETTCWAVSTPYQSEKCWDNVGTPLDCCEIKIAKIEHIDDNSLLFDPSDRTVNGEILIKGPLVTPGYFKNAQLNKQSITEDGFFKTGDLGFIDENNLLHVTGRLKEILIKNGKNIFTVDIDRILSQHPAIQSSKTIGIPDPIVGERIFSVCVRKENTNLTERELRDWSQNRLSQHSWPDTYFFMGHLPTTPSGKISINILRKIILGHLSDEMLSALNSWKYKRAQPSDTETVRRNLQQALVAGTPVSFLSYWGCGKRDTLSEHDRLALDRLAQYIHNIKRAPNTPGEITLIFTDSHARNNRIPEDRMNRYFQVIREYAKQLNIGTMFLSDIWASQKIDPARVLDFIETPEFAERWNSEPLRERLIEQASKHVEGNHSHEKAAQYYYYACELEGKAIANLYPTSLFLTYNHPAFDCLSPTLPKLYLHSYKEGSSVKPWFID